MCIGHWADQQPLQQSTKRKWDWCRIWWGQFAFDLSCMLCCVYTCGVVLLSKGYLAESDDGDAGTMGDVPFDDVFLSPAVSFEPLEHDGGQFVGDAWDSIFVFVKSSSQLLRGYTSDRSSTSHSPAGPDLDDDLAMAMLTVSRVNQTKHNKRKLTKVGELEFITIPKASHKAQTSLDVVTARLAHGANTHQWHPSQPQTATVAHWGNFGCTQGNSKVNGEGTSVFDGHYWEQP